LIGLLRAFGRARKADRVTKRAWGQKKKIGAAPCKHAGLWTTGPGGIVAAWLVSTGSVVEVCLRPR